MAIMLDLKLDLLKVQEMISKCFIWKMNLHLSLTLGGFFFTLTFFFLLFFYFPCNDLSSWLDFSD